LDPELLRPPPQRDWRARLAELRAAIPLSAAGIVAASIGAVVAVGGGVVAFRALQAPPPPELSLPRATPPAAARATTSMAGPVVVHVAGAVARPGVYPLQPGARVVDAIGAAGGTGPDADLDPLNLATRLSDGDRVFVPHRGQAPPAVIGPGPSGDAGSGDSSGPIDLNSADAEELETLPGVGPATAQAIIAWREQHGPFRSVQDLLQVRGIGPAKLEALRDLVTA
jgi:competence protein ComEA